METLEDRCVPTTTPGLPADGYLDPSFGAAGAGLTTTPIAVINNSGNQGVGQRVLIQPDGKVIAISGGNVVRYNTDGSLDNSFGSGGIVNFTGNSAALQSDGKILLAGISASSGFSLTRLNTNGSLDTSFGNQGVVTTSFSDSTAATQIVVQPDGKILLAGGGGVQNGKASAALELARYNTNGSLDTSFGQRGTVTTSFSKALPGAYLSAQSLLLQSNGDLIVVADTDIWAPQEWLMARYTNSGSLDSTFGNKGIVTTPSGSGQIGSAWVGGAVLYPSAGTTNDGKIAIVGANLALSAGPVLARFNSNGTLDTTFGNGGFVPLGMTPFGVAFDSSERFIVAGMNDIALQRLNPDGTPDTSFGGGGVVSAGLPGTHGDGLAIYPSSGTDTADAGKIALVGLTGSFSGTGFVVARSLPSAPQSGPNFVVTVPATNTAGVPFAVTVAATDGNGNVLTNYTGTVDFSSFDPQAILPANYTFTAADQGVHTFTLTFKAAVSTAALFVGDTVTPSINGRAVGLVVTPGAAVRFVLTGPSSVASGSPFFLYAYAVDAYGNTTSTSDTVHLTSSDPSAKLPADEAFSTNLQTVVLRTKGTQTITVTDVANSSIVGTLTLTVT